MHDRYPDFFVTYLPVDTLVPFGRNARTHTKKQIRQIAKSIERFGFTNPVLIGNDGQIIAGHGRVEAAKQRVPTLSEPLSAARVDGNGAKSLG